MNEQIKIRLATIIDCEGWVALYPVKEKKRWKFKKPIVEVSQKDKWYVKRFKEIFGFGYVYLQKKHNVWYYRATYLQALKVCLILRDYTELKKENMDKIIEYYRDRLKSSSNRTRRTLLTKMKHYEIETLK